eukprot:13838792-Alexandrium_andersonii.AAC.1
MSASLVGSEMCIRDRALWASASLCGGGSALALRATRPKQRGRRVDSSRVAPTYFRKRNLFFFSRDERALESLARPFAAT